MKYPIRIICTIILLTLLNLGQPMLFSQASVPEQPRRVFLPVVGKNYPSFSHFGFEITKPISAIQGKNLDESEPIAALGAQWIRLNGRISWRELQPDLGQPIAWEKLASFDEELQHIKRLGLLPIVVVDDYPSWAVQPYLDTNAQQWVYSSCAALRTEHFKTFAGFVRQLVARYQSSVHHWELGNEVDVSPLQVAKDSIYGCWGDVQDPYFGGRHYGEMLKVVTPAIKAVDPSATVWIGGLLLDKPNSQPSELPVEKFFEGILLAGAAPYFDMVAYHAYPAYQIERLDYDLNPANRWYAWGGLLAGKARFLRQVMQQYGVSKPLFVNEIGLTCPEQLGYCANPGADFFHAQADMLVRMFVRSIAHNITGVTWYALDDPGWRHVGLLDRQNSPRPAYHAFKVLSAQLNDAEYISPTPAYPGVAGYVFRTASHQVQVLWAEQDEWISLAIPQNSWIAGYDIYGQPLACLSAGGNCQIEVGFAPIYVLQNP
jgi:hypothetical protein